MPGKRVLFVLSVLVTAMFAMPAAPAANSIRPGIFMSTDVGCTLNFVYDGQGDLAGNVYMGTAAHCVSKVGQDVSLDDGTVFGDVAAIGRASAAATDWALIQVRPAYISRVRAGVAGHPTAPTGYAKTSKLGEEVFFSGYGVGFDTTATTREKRFGFMETQSKTRYTLIGSDTYGDSGGPIILATDGKAMGIVSRMCISACTSEGPTVYGMLLQAANKGFPVTLRTVTATP